MSCMTIHFLNFRITRSDIRLHIKWVVQTGDLSVYYTNLNGFSWIFQLALSIMNIGVLCKFRLIFMVVL